jgi:copper chaperone CopZ
MKLETTQLEITGDFTMHCKGCERTVKFALKTLSGIQQVEPSYKTQRIQIIHNPEEVTTTSIQEKLADLGYETSLIS